MYNTIFNLKIFITPAGLDFETVEKTVVNLLELSVPNLGAQAIRMECCCNGEQEV